MQGTDPSVVRRAVADEEPLPGTGGFAGRVDGALVRDVLGRYPLFAERAAVDPVDSDAWSADPTDLADPVSVPGGHRVDGDGSERLFSLPDPSPVSDDRAAVAAVREAVRRSVDAVEQSSTDTPSSRTQEDTVGKGADEPSVADASEDDDGLAVAFSGGVDSAILAARLDAPLYVAGFPDSHDVDAARSAAEALGADLTVVELTHADLERAVPETVAATGRTNAMDVQIALPIYLTAERVAADGFARLALGQGADELFGGYAKVAKAPEDPRVEADTVRGARREVVRSLPDQLERDVLTVRSAGVEPVTPLLHDRVVEAALALSGDLLVDADGTRKVALRRAAAEWLPGDVAARDKKAVQYGSLVSRELDRLARQAGYKRRMDDHVSKYVTSLVE